MNIQVRLFTIKTNNIENSRKFYELIGINFIKQQHSGGPEHYHSEDLGFSFEIYPVADSISNHIVIGMEVLDIKNIRQKFLHNKFECSEIYTNNYGTQFVTRDPDNNRVEIYER